MVLLMVDHCVMMKFKLSEKQMVLFSQKALLNSSEYINNFNGECMSIDCLCTLVIFLYVVYPFYCSLYTLLQYFT